GVFEVDKIERAALEKADYRLMAEYGIAITTGEIDALLAATGCPDLTAFVGLFRTPEGEQKAIAALEQVIGKGDRTAALAQAFYQLCHNTEIEELRTLFGDEFDEADLLKIYDFLRYRAARNEMTVAGLLRSDPFHLVHVPELSKGREGAYSVAQKLAEKLGMSNDLVKKMGACISMYLWQQAEQGHTYCERKKVTGIVLKRLGAFKDFTEADTYVKELLPQPGKTTVWPSSAFAWEYKLLKAPCVYLAGVYHSERMAAESLIEILKSPPAVKVDAEQLVRAAREAAYVPLNREQEEFIRAVARSKVVLLDGEAGTGKTAALAALVRGYRQLTGEDVAVLAPTGIAARRLGELAGVNLNFTIHRFAEIDRAAKDLAVKEFIVGVKEKTASGKELEVEKWNVSLVVVDEMSMADVVMLGRLLNRCLPECRLVLAGDSGQLPPVGPGPVFKELLRLAEEELPDGMERITLSRVYRQEEANLLDLARAVRRGNFRVPPAGVEVIEAKPEEVHNRAVEVAVQIWQNYGGAQVMVLTPKHFGDRRK
ncbi:MAG: ATP-dependent DNA helicase, partial [Desulfotomaculales bacterium]